MLPSSKLTLMKVSSADQGWYTCMAKHPSVGVLKKSRTIRITVLSGKDHTLDVLWLLLFIM